MDSSRLKTDTAKQRFDQVIRAIDRIAGRDQLAFLTTQRVSRESGISDGVLFRHFSSKEAMLAAWVELRGEQLRQLLESMPAGRSGLLHLLRRLLGQEVLLSFLCCQPMDSPALRRQLESCRSQCYRAIRLKIELLSSAPVGVAPEVLTDHLMQSIQRAWNPENSDRERHKEMLMNQLPWEQHDSGDELFPAREILQRLALNDSGFVFDPVNGRSFTANDVGLYVLRFLQQHDDPEALIDSICGDFDVLPADARRDVTEFAAQLRKFLA